MEKADICTHPNWCPADEEWWGDQPPFVGNKQKPRQPVETKNYKQEKLI